MSDADLQRILELEEWLRDTEPSHVAREILRLRAQLTAQSRALTIAKEALETLQEQNHVLEFDDGDGSSV